ncbi:IucC family-domain-containing protein [Dichotomocladium elegans]|nr:IucC family-domain-containing protein [Dichotomocladium elegans]
MTTSKNVHYGKFATTSRLVSCFVSEGLVTARFIPRDAEATNDAADLVGVCLITRKHSRDVLVAVPLRGMPEIIDHGHEHPRIELVDPWDMLPYIYAPHERSETYRVLAPSPHLPGAERVLEATMSTLNRAGINMGCPFVVDDLDAVELWRRYAKEYDVKKELVEEISTELGSSIAHQIFAYDHPKELPTLQSASFQWEQVILEGHATHPMHKARKSFPPLPPVCPGADDLEQPKLRLVAIPASSVKVRGPFQELIEPLVDAMLAKTYTNRASSFSSDQVLVPVHAFQVPNITHRFQDIVLLPKENNMAAEALTSIRSVEIPGVLNDLSLKLCIGVKVTSALRIVSPFSTHFGPGFSSNVIPHLTYDHDILHIQRELASVIYNHPDTDMAKHCSCVIRECKEEEGEINIVAAALVEKIQKADTDETLVKHVWNLHSEQASAAFLDRYVKFALKAFIPPLITNGVAFEAHGQNTIARFDRKTGELKGFAIRDFGGIKVHNETLKRSCGVEIDVLPDSHVVAASMEDCYKLIYHTLFHSHFQRLIRVLGLHHNGLGWKIVRKHVDMIIPKDDPVYKYLVTQEKIPGKCLMRMKINELFRDYIYEPVPNMILSQPHALGMNTLLC